MSRGAEQVAVMHHRVLMSYVMLLLTCVAMTSAQVNECSSSTHLCAATVSSCRDTDSSYECDCSPGYYHFGSDPITCHQSASTCGTRHLFAASTSNTIRPTTQLTWSAAQTVCRQNQGSLVPSPALESGDYRQLPYFRCIESLLTSFFPFTSSSLHVWTPTCSSTQSCGIILIDQFQPANNEYRPDWDTSNAQFAYLALCLRDRNECTDGSHNCRIDSEDCVDTDTLFTCRCKLGYSRTVRTNNMCTVTETSCGGGRQFIIPDTPNGAYQPTSIEGLCRKHNGTLVTREPASSKLLKCLRTLAVPLTQQFGELVVFLINCETASSVCRFHRYDQTDRTRDETFTVPTVTKNLVFATNPLCERDRDECTDGSHTCMQPSQACQNTDGSFTCMCAEGYRPINGAGCYLRSLTCPGQTIIVKEPGNYTRPRVDTICQDQSLLIYQYDQANRACYERLIHPITVALGVPTTAWSGNCMGTACPVITLSSVTTSTGAIAFGTLNPTDTVRLAVCVGYIDECQQGSHNCDTTTTTCTNTQFSFRCDCKPRQVHINPQTCEIPAVNECMTGNHTCDTATQTCQDTRFSFTCPCRPGFYSVGTPATCTELVVRATCGGGQQFVLSEPMGAHAWQAASSACTANGAKLSTRALTFPSCIGRLLRPYAARHNVDRLSVWSGDCQENAATCTIWTIDRSVPSQDGSSQSQSSQQLPGSVVIMCESDVNECDLSSHNCNLSSTTCVNTDGSFECVCRSGLFYGVNKLSCLPPVNQTIIGGYMYFIGSNSNDRYNWRQANDNCRAQNAALLTNYVDISTDLLTFLRPITFQRGRDLGFWSGICSTGGTACEAIATNRGTMGSIMSLGEVQTSMTYNTNVCIREHDECSAGTHTCNRMTESCVNTIGSFSCDCLPTSRRYSTGQTCISFQSQCGGGSQTLYGQGMTVHNWAQANMICAGRNATLPMRFDPREAASLQCFARLLQPVATALGRDLAVWASVSTTDTTSDFFAISGGRSDYRQNRMKSQDANVFQVLCETDIDECLTGTHVCNGTSSTCRNTDGLYSCPCKAGFIRDPSQSLLCIDVDECATSTSRCDGDTTTCSNTYGSYICPCKEGVSESSINKMICGNPPSLTSPGSLEASVVIGGTTSFSCATARNGNSNTTWMSKNNSMISPEQITDSVMGSLRVSELSLTASLTSAGLYQCRVENEFGAVTRVFTLSTQSVTSSAASSKTLLPAIIGGSLGVVLIGLFITYFLVKRNNSKARRFEPRTAPHPLPAEGLPASMPEIALDAQLPPVLSAHSTLVQCASDLSILAQDHGFYDSSPTATASSSCTDLEGKQAVRFANGKAHYTLDSASDNLSRSDSAKKSKSDSKLAPEVIRRSKVHAPAGHTVSNATMLDHDPESTYYGTPDTVASDEAEAVACSNANKVRREEIDYDVASLDQYQVDRVPSVEINGGRTALPVPYSEPYGKQKIKNSTFVYSQTSPKSQK